MLKAKRKNRVVRIPDEKADEYKTLGYAITTMDDRVLSEPEDKGKKIAALQAENAGLRGEKSALRTENEALRKEKAALQAENADLKRQLSESKRREDSPGTPTAPEEPESETETPGDGGTSDAATGAGKKKAAKNRASS